MLLNETEKICFVDWSVCFLISVIFWQKTLNFSDTVVLFQKWAGRQKVRASQEQISPVGVGHPLLLWSTCSRQAELYHFISSSSFLTFAPMSSWNMWNSQIFKIELQGINTVLKHCRQFDISCHFKFNTLNIQTSDRKISLLQHVSLL